MTASRIGSIFEAVGKPECMRTFHGYAAIVWLAISIPTSILFGHLTIFVTFLSLYAIVVGHWSSWQAARVEVRQEEIEQERKDD